jgi:hypothetical protein
MGFRKISRQKECCQGMPASPKLLPTFANAANGLAMSIIIQVPLEIVTPFKRYDPVGHCIYCPAYPKNPTKEHIIPFGLADDSLVLPRASCSDCQKKTHEAETACMRATWWPFRTHIGAPSRGKEHPSSFEMTYALAHDLPSGIQLSNTTKEKRAPKDFPFIFSALRLHPPGLLVGRDPNAHVDVDVWSTYDDEMLAEVRRRATGLPRNLGIAAQIAQINPPLFGRMLAKIAHGYAAAELGLHAFKHDITRIVRNEPTRTTHWIGGTYELPPPAPHLHNIRWRIQAVNRINYVIVDLRLFAFMGSPQYHIVVGELIHPLDQLPFLEQPLYIIDVKTQTST